MVAATSTAAEEGSKTLGGLVVVAVPRWDPPNLLATDLPPQTSHPQDVWLRSTMHLRVRLSGGAWPQCSWK